MGWKPESCFLQIVDRFRGVRLFFLLECLLVVVCSPLLYLSIFLLLKIIGFSRTELVFFQNFQKVVTQSTRELKFLKIPPRDLNNDTTFILLT